MEASIGLTPFMAFTPKWVEAEYERSYHGAFKAFDLEFSIFAVTAVALCTCRSWHTYSAAELAFTFAMSLTRVAVVLTARALDARGIAPYGRLRPLCIESVRWVRVLVFLFVWHQAPRAPCTFLRMACIAATAGFAITPFANPGWRRHSVTAAATLAVSLLALLAPGGVVNALAARAAAGERECEVAHGMLVASSEWLLRHVPVPYMDVPPTPRDPCRAVAAFAAITACLLSSLAVFLFESHSRRVYAAAVHGVRVTTADLQVSLVPVVAAMLLALWVLCTQLL